MKRIALLICSCLWLNSALAGTSAENRGERYLQIGLVPVGLHIPTLLTSPAIVGVHLGESLIVGGEWGSGKSTSSMDFYNGETLDQTVINNQGVFVRWFMGNSFNMYLARHHRSFSTDYSYDAYFDYSSVWWNTDKFVTGKLEGSAEVNTLALGNSWMLNIGLTIGADWVVASQVVNSNSKITLDSYKGYSRAEARQRMEKSAEKGLQYLGSSGIGVMHITYSF